MSSDPSPPVPSFHLDAIPADSHTTDDGPMAALVGMLDLQAALAGIRRMREWGHEVLAVEPGERVLDIGAGTGTEVIALSDRVGPEGDAVGVDPNPAMLAVARGRAEAANARARFVEATAYRLPFSDGYFDAVRCERVYQHLDDPTAATTEITRVLRPGGRVLLIDTDWHTVIAHPGDPDVLDRLSKAMLATIPDPASGRRLRGRLATAGFTIDDMGSQAVIWNPDTAVPLYAQMIASAVHGGAITEPEGDALLSSMRAGITTGDYHLSVTMFAVLAHRAR